MPRLLVRNFLLWVTVLAVVAAAISVVWAAYFRDPNLHLDEKYYYPLAESIIAGDYHDGYLIRPPVYPLFLAGVLKVFGRSFLPALAFQGILRGLVVAMVAWLGRRYISDAAGLTAAVLLTFSPALLLAYMSFLSEAAYIPLFLISFFFIEQASRSERIPGALKAGLASGAAALARSTSLFLGTFLAVWFAVGKSRTGRLSRRNMIRAVVLVAGIFAAISPWTVRNAVVYRSFIPIGDDSAFNLWLMTSGSNIKVASHEWASWGTHPERQREAYRRWLEYLREHPMFHVKRFGVVLPRIFSTSWESPVPYLSTLYAGGGQPYSVPAVKRTLTVLHAGIMWIIYAGGIVGLLSLERNGKRKTLVLLVVAFFILLHGATLARARYMLPVECLLSIYSGALISFSLGWLRQLRKRLSMHALCSHFE